MITEQPRGGFSLDIFLLLPILGLMTIGILFIYSSGVDSSGVLVTNEYLKQLAWALVALSLLIAFSYINYNILGDFSVWLYGIFIALLVLTLLFGKVVNGAKAWIGIFGLGGQPSEFAKIATLLFLSHYLSGKQRNEVNTPKVLSRALAIVLLPMALILKQPDTGTTLVFIPITLMIFLSAGVRLRTIIYIAVTGVLSIIFALVPYVLQIIYHESYGLATLLTEPKSIIGIVGLFAILSALTLYGWVRFRSRIFFILLYIFSIGLISFSAGLLLHKVLKDYQVMRFIVFLDPSIDPQGSGWNLIQSMTAIGSGGFWGKGFLMGTQSHYRFLPMQSTDFIFSILGEEWGFLGTTTVFVLFMTLIFRLLYIMGTVKEPFGVFVVSGFLGLFLTHMLVNVGMTIGIMPVTGIPLYFLSYGGSSLVAGSIAVGIATNIYKRRFRFS